MDIKQKILSHLFMNISDLVLDVHVIYTFGWISQNKISNWAYIKTYHPCRACGYYNEWN